MRAWSIAGSRKGYRSHPLPAPERARNAELAVTRALVEAIFGTLKDVWGLARSRFMGLGRNRCQWQLAAVTVESHMKIRSGSSA